MDPCEHSNEPPSFLKFWGRVVKLKNCV